MPPARRIAAMFDADQLTVRERDTVVGITRYAGEAGWHLTLDPFALHHPVADWDGMLVPTHKCLGKLLRRAELPIVCIGSSQESLSFPRAFESRFAGGRIAARHFIERGYRAFAYVGFTRTVSSSFERIEFRDALGRAGRRMGAARVAIQPTQKPQQRQGVIAALGNWLARLEPPAGIFVARPGLARALADIVLARGLRIPQDVGLIAADDEPAVCELPPALTSLRFDYTEVGYRAAELLGRLLAGEPKPKQAVLIPPTLIPRASTDRLASGDPVVANALWFIDSRRTEAIRPADVAAAAGVAERQLQRHFRRAGRGTIQAEITKARIEHAKLGLDELRRHGAPPEGHGGPHVEVTFDGPPGIEGGEGWRQWHEDPRRRAARIERTLDGIERIRRHPLPMPDEPPARPRRVGLAVVARDSGFSSALALIRAFKRHLGMTPREWMKRRT